MRNKARPYVSFLGLLLAGMFALSVPAPTAPAQARPPAVDAKMRAEVVQKVGDLLVGQYVFPEKGKAMKDFLDKQLAEKKYDTLTDVREFAQALTRDIQSVTKDRHLRVAFNPDEVRRIRARNGQSAEDRAKEAKEALERQRQENFGFRKVEILDGNIGYLNLLSFSGAREAGDTIVAAMNFLANANAVIIDLRDNGGGAALAIKLICSYFLPEETHINSWEWRGRDGIVQSWSLPYVPGRMMFDKDLYILTSRRTFSAAEEFTADLKNQKRATIVGETTGGGAHPGGTRIVNDDFTVWIPTGRAINPVSKTNWEGTGIEPDISVPRDKALDKAHLTAVSRLLEKPGEEAVKQSLKWAHDGLLARLEPPPVDLETLKKYTGRYGEVVVTLENGILFVQTGSSKLKLIPASASLFVPEGVDGPRVEFRTGENGRITEAVAHFRNGRTEAYPRTPKE